MTRAIQLMDNSVRHHDFRYVIRADISGYYANISHKKLLEQVNTHFDDPVLRCYFNDIIETAIDDGGHVFAPE